MSVQRWYFSAEHGALWTQDDGHFVTYADHARIVAEEVDKARRENAYLPSVKAAFDRGYEQGKADMQQAHAAALAGVRQQTLDESAARAERLLRGRPHAALEEAMSQAYDAGAAAAPRTLTADDRAGLLRLREWVKERWDMTPQDVLSQIDQRLIHDGEATPQDDPPCVTCQVKRSVHGHYWATGHPYYPSPSGAAIDGEATP